MDPVIEKKFHPLIGISARSDMLGGQAVYKTNARYAEAVMEAGGIPVLLPMLPDLKEEDLHSFLSGIQGLLVPGGGDLDPAFYGEKPLEGPAFYGDLTGEAVRSQAAELKLIRMAAEDEKPILGICLGIQAINVAFGGSLYQDIDREAVPGRKTVEHHQNAPRPEGTHRISIRKQTLLEQIFETDGLKVNSFHHQAVKRTAPGFTVSALSEDGIVEAIEKPEACILGVQWHPEWLAVSDQEQMRLFGWLTEKAAEQKSGAFH